MMRSIARLRRDRRAVAALEFALLSVPLLLLVLGTMEFGRLLWMQQALQSTATAGARCMGIRAGSCTTGGSYNAATAKYYMEGLASNWGVTLADSNFSTLTTNSANSECSGLSEVQISYTFNSAVPGLMTMITGKSLTGRACFPNQS